MMSQWAHVLMSWLDLDVELAMDRILSSSNFQPRSILWSAGLVIRLMTQRTDSLKERKLFPHSSILIPLLIRLSCMVHCITQDWGSCHMFTFMHPIPWHQNIHFLKLKSYKANGRIMFLMRQYTVQLDCTLVWVYLNEFKWLALKEKKSTLSTFTFGIVITLRRTIGGTDHGSDYSGSTN
jgi:hypothetical protein